MGQQNTRRLRDGHTVAVHRNGGVRKLCTCPRRHWAKCKHGWYFNFQGYRFSLDHFFGKHLSKTEAVGAADKIRAEIRAGTFSLSHQPRKPEPLLSTEPRTSPLFETVAAMFVDSGKDRGKTSWQDDASMVKQLMAFTPPWRDAGRLGAQSINAVTEQDLEAFVRHLGTLGRTAATLNHYVRVLRAMDRWLVRKGYRATRLLSGESDVIKKRKATKRSRRLATHEEAKLLAMAGPHLQRVIICALETGSRVGEILSLQWGEVSLKRLEILLRADKTKTATNRTIPISARLHAVLDMMKSDADSEGFGPSEYVFGNEVGERARMSSARGRQPC